MVSSVVAGTKALPGAFLQMLHIALAKRPQRASDLVSLDSIRNVVFFFFVLRWSRRAFYKLKGRGPIGTMVEIYHSIRRVLYGYLLQTPSVRSQVEKDVGDALAKLEKKLVPAGMTRNTVLPRKGLSEEALLKELETLANMDHTRWEDGCVSGTVYHGEDDLIRLQTEAYGKFTVSNPIHPDVFPGVRKMEAEVVAMVLSLFNAPEGAAGVTSSGGTDSILMACLAARQRGYLEHGITEPEMILPETAHVAFRKACEYFKIKMHLVECPAPSHKVNIKAVSRLITRNTVLLVGSAPNFPHGIVDDISALSDLSIKNDICLHVDCCLGSFLMPFLERAGFETPAFDFRLPGVTSISCDTHKYGFAPKGNSTVLYRSARLRLFQYYVSPDWSGGIYASPGLAGSRPGALIAGCWTSMMNVGQDGYLDACRKIVSTTRNIRTAIETQPSLSSELAIIGDPKISVVAFRARTLNTYDISDAMSAKGWHLNALQNPAAIHVAVTMPIVKVWEQLIKDLEEVIVAQREKSRLLAKQGKAAKKPTGDSAVLYGVAGSLPNKSVVVDLASGFLDLLYKA
ncbi:Sphingosine-1-phosphate lyase [Ceratocystis lukuohia]|uniref:sphinganine-1-phosphate aldolase n=1 Tax=Ceratocystis lukuohia TaxID=2019550 RepID=A0ABR4MSV8_9PEZI